MEAKSSTNFSVAGVYSFSKWYSLIRGAVFWIRITYVLPRTSNVKPFWLVNRRSLLLLSSHIATKKNVWFQINLISDLCQKMPGRRIVKSIRSQCGLGPTRHWYVVQVCFGSSPCSQNFSAAVLVFIIHLNLGNIFKFKLDVESEGHWLITIMR